jgi:hypothetical protein
MGKGGRKRREFGEKLGRDYLRLEVVWKASLVCHTSFLTLKVSGARDNL